MRRSLVARRGLRLRHLSLLRAGRAIAPAVAYQQQLPLTNHPNNDNLETHPKYTPVNISEFRNQGLLAVLGGADTFSNQVTLGDTGWLLLANLEQPGATRGSPCSPFQPFAESRSNISAWFWIFNPEKSGPGKSWG